MKTRLASVPLRSGESMTVWRLETPEPETGPELCEFLAYNQILRDIRQRLEGHYASFCVDKYFVGEIDGEIVGQMYYGYPRKTTGIGNFGNVYTAPHHRKKGITSALMPFLLDDFHRSPAKALLCGTGTPWVAAFYLKHGFQTILPGADCGPLYLPNQGAPPTFEALAAEYFVPTSEPLKVELGTMKECFDIDKVLLYDMMRRNALAPKVALAHALPDYRRSVLMVEDGKGIIVVGKLPSQAVPAWACFLNPASACEQESKIFDFTIHPDYGDHAAAFLHNALDLAAGEGITTAYACLPEAAEDRIALLTAAGFVVTAGLKDYCTIDHAACALCILKCDLAWG